MTSKTLCIAGFSREDSAAVQARFEEANARLGYSWSLLSESEADVLLIDMDSMYGHMTWLKAHNSGKVTIALTAGTRSETDHLLTRPLETDALANLLGEISGQKPSATPGPKPVSMSVAEAVARNTGQQAAVGAARTTGQQAATPPATPPATPRTTGQQAAMPADPVRSTGQQAAMPADPVRSTGQQAAMPADPVRSTGQMAAAPAAPPRDPRLGDYLKPGAFSGPVKAQLPGAPLLVLDPATQTYAGGSTLKVFLPYAEAVMREGDFTAIDAAEYASLSKQLGGSQPWSRLAWLGGLAGHKGVIAPGHDPNAQYKLNKWPQSEREYPKHFRIATVMMKGPARLTEISEQSGATLAEVTDFVNANLATGYASPA
ncbi:hypothetical protein [Arenimonas sp.]|uniref:hypothetical protein n=1 Tax=Arenimonas sp. TaxID=1872635 RepID=UPI0039E619A1